MKPHPCLTHFLACGLLLAATLPAEKITVGLLADWAEKNSASGSPSSNFTLSVTRALREKWQVQAYTVLGNSVSTADHGFGLTLSRRF